ncbi:MAG: RecQ family ATP-dependent DNA helicase [Candidatus Izemoplasma sp.]|nr:RecQ family ATP-dependent DNA helicase [Candidatus Izemoplasma sp.]
MAIVFIDLEVDGKNNVKDYGAFVDRNHHFHGNNKGFIKFIKRYDTICGHNVLMHDLRYIDKEVKKAGIKQVIDTLPLSALLFAKRPYHSLVKNYKLKRDLNNDPFVDASLSHHLFVEEVEEWNRLDDNLKQIYYALLKSSDAFKDFFKYVGYKPYVENLKTLILERFNGQICSSVDISQLIHNYPEELAYCLAVINVSDQQSIAPNWVVHKYNNYQFVMDTLRGIPCHNCSYCTDHFNSKDALKQYFGYDSFRRFEGKSLQENAVNAQIDGKSILAIFPTAGGKSLTFQLPALMMGENVKGLTIVISPLQSLMNDQVENLKQKGINNVGTINGSMNTLERRNTLRDLRDGKINLLYIAPEMLRSPSTLKRLSKRNISRFVIDEAHCFSTWGHDFRVDYLYIATFIKNLQEESLKNKTIPVSCFTATAKEEVIEDIQDYFKSNLGIDMEVYRANTRRHNLHFYVKKCDGHKEKMIYIKDLLEDNRNKPVIIYTTRRKSAEKVADELNDSGFTARSYHGGMEIERKNQYQLAFSQGDVNIIVATSAFGMGVDKSDVAFVIHYQVSSTIEDYMQEAGRGGRDPNIDAQCHILYDEKDVEAHFSLLTSQKLTKSDINQVWKAIRSSTKQQNHLTISAKELVRRTGWDEETTIFDETTKVKTCILALEKAKYIERQENAATVYASSILPKTMKEATKKIEQLKNFDDNEKMQLQRIMTRLYTDKTTRIERGSKPITMIDDLYDELDLTKREIIRYINILKDFKLIKDDDDLVVQIPTDFKKNKSQKVMTNYINIMRKFIALVDDDKNFYSLKKLNSEIKEHIPASDGYALRRVINFLSEQKYIRETRVPRKVHHRYLSLLKPKEEIETYISNLASLTEFIINYSYKKFAAHNTDSIGYSLVQIKNAYNEQPSLFNSTTSLLECEQALLLINRVGSLIIDGGFLVLYNPMKIKRIEQGARTLYKDEDYDYFKRYYQNKIKKVHLLIHFVSVMQEDKQKGLELVDDYFNLSYQAFEDKYITDEYKNFINRPMTQGKYDELFKTLTNEQQAIINSKEENIVVLAGPGSGKTTLLVHKLASLIELEDVKVNQLLMLTFSRSATIVFKKRLYNLIGPKANYVDIKTFHSFCFDVLGEVGNIDYNDKLFKRAIAKIEQKNVVESIVNKTTLVIDEAQDMSKSDYELIKALMEWNNGLKIIAVGDDDQNIYAFRGSNAKYFYDLTKQGARIYELSINFRSKANLVDFTQKFVRKIKDRFKEKSGVSYTKEDGNILLYKYQSEYLYSPLLNMIKSMDSKKTTAILTPTNEQSEIIAGELDDHGIHVSLIQDNANYRLSMLKEVDELKRLFDSDNNVISKRRWKELTQMFLKSKKDNHLHENLKNLILGFDVLYPNQKYRVDLETYLDEMHLQDLYKEKNGIITVSTMHKSKGREFENVFLLVDKEMHDQETLRALYVSMTRAKSNLVILTNTDLFDDLPYSKITQDQKIYERPQSLSVQMTLYDVNLGGGKYIQHIMNKINTGTELNVEENKLTYLGKDALYFSNKMKEDIESKLEKGYRLSKAYVKYIVKWYDSDSDKYYWIPLPRVIYQKEN